MRVGLMKLLTLLLMATLISSAALASDNSNSSLPSFFLFPKRKSPTTVIIVGAGMSGISAGKVLHDNGIKELIILEATDRIGGRIHKAEFGGHTVEKGANWLHGAEGPQKNPLYEMAKQIKLKTFFSDFSNVSSNTYKQVGALYPKDEVESALEKSDDNEEFGDKLSEKLNAQGKDDDDMSILAAERLNHREPKTRLEKMIDFYVNDGEQAEEPRVSSLKHVLPRPEFTWYGDSEYFVADPRGFESLVHEVAKTYLSYKDDAVDDKRLLFNQAVVEVEYTKQGVTVRTEDGKVYKADYIILSPSVGVLQTDLIKFKPELPDWKRRSINEFSLGIYTKIFLKFPQRFWPNSGPGTEFFFYVHQRRGYYAIWQQLENEYPGANIMFVTVADDESIRVEEQSDEQTKAEIMEILRKIYGKDIPDPTDIMVPRWHSDRFFRGTFSNWPVGYTTKKHNQLRAPVGRVYFTGEHTHPNLFGYADGAYFAGADTAKALIQCAKNHVCKGY